MIRINRNRDLISIHDLMFYINMVIGIGNNSAVSTSEIMKITAIRKNRDENSSRAEFFLVEPAFKWIFFSRFSLIFFRLSLLLLWEWR